MFTFKTQRAKRTFSAEDINVCYADFAAFCLCLYCGRRNLSQMWYETRGDAAGFSKPAVQDQQTCRISSLPLAAIIFSPQPVQESLCALRHRPLREQNTVTCVFNSDIGQPDKRTVVNFWRYQIIPEGDPLTIHHRLNAAVRVWDRQAGPAGRVR